MSGGENRLAERAAALRSAFDRSFAAAPAAATGELEDFLTVRVGADSYAIRLAEIAGLHADRKVTPLPSHAPELLGVVAVRGVLAPVYDLRALLGYSGGAPLRWLVLARAVEPVGLAFDRFETHLRVARERVSSPERGEHARRHVRGSVHTAAGALPLIHVGSVLAAVQQPKER